MIIPIVINGAAIDFVESIKYLGITVTSQPSLTYSANDDLRAFYRSANSILNVVNGPEEAVKMQLLYSNCIPILTYASAVKQFSSRDMTSCNTAVNDAIRIIFTFHRWESVRTLREIFGYKPLIELFAQS